MAPERPAWIIKDIASILGFDEGTIVQLVIPDLETYTNETKLKAHLQDFLGPGPASKAFINKYLQHQFPRLPTVEHAPSNPGPVKPLFSQPPKAYAGSAAGSSTSQSRPSSSAGGASFTRQPPPHASSIPAALESAFGPGGKVYQKNRDADVSSFTGSIRHGGGSGPGSGSSTPSGSMHPSRQQAMRHAGAVTITEAKPKAGGVGMSSGGSGKGKQRAAEKIWDAPKSAAVVKLEQMLEALKGMQMSEGKVRRVDEGKECFCQARLHPLSPHTPQCAACGLIQCHVQPPDRACPSCFRPLLTPSSLARLVQRVQVEIEEQLAKEQSARDEVKRIEQRKIEEAAAFPYLAGAGAGAPAPVKADAGHRVLTIDKGKGRITLKTTTHAPPPPPVEAEPERYSEAVIARPRSPPLEHARTEKELAKNLKWRSEEDRPWGDMKAVKKGEGWAYVEQKIVEILNEDGMGRRKGRKGKGTEGVNGRVVPGASAVPA